MHKHPQFNTYQPTGSILTPKFTQIPKSPKQPLSRYHRSPQTVFSFNFRNRQSSKFLTPSTEARKHSWEPRATQIYRCPWCFREKYRQQAPNPLSQSSWPSPYRFLADGVSRYSLSPPSIHTTAPSSPLTLGRSPFFVTLAVAHLVVPLFFVLLLSRYTYTRVPASPVPRTVNEH